MAEEESKEWLGAPEYARKIGRKLNTVYKMNAAGRITKVKKLPNGRLLVHRSARILPAAKGRRPASTVKMARINPDGPGSRMLQNGLAPSEVARREGVDRSRVYTLLDKGRIVGAERRSWGWYIPPDYKIIRFESGSGRPLEGEAV